MPHSLGQLSHFFAHSSRTRADSSLLSKHKQNSIFLSQQSISLAPAFLDDSEHQGWVYSHGTRLCTSIPAFCLLLLLSCSKHNEYKHPARAGGMGTTVRGEQKHGHLPALSLTSSPGWGACFMQDSPLPRSTGCPTLARGQWGPTTATAPDSSLGATPLPWERAYFTDAWISSWTQLAPPSPVSFEDLEADTSDSAGLR